jgi:hypothetical protein
MNDFQEFYKLSQNLSFIASWYIAVLFIATLNNVILTLGLRQKHKISLTLGLKKLWVSLPKSIFRIKV